MERRFARKDVLLIPNQIYKLIIANYANKSKLHNKVAYAGRNPMFLGKCNETKHLKSTYYEKLMKQDFYKHITIRNVKTHKKTTEIVRDKEE